MNKDCSYILDDVEIPVSLFELIILRDLMRSLYKLDMRECTYAYYRIKGVLYKVRLFDE